ncbi:MAG: sigma-70 family RNA polymerase sigma factor [Akkermansia sp.]|nr:sigma-70 family RNA polymerase sigma factor [Akkermansia sp.]
MQHPPLHQSNSDIDSPIIYEHAESTRKSLIAKLDNWEDQQTWNDFYRTYWRLIFSVAHNAGLRDDEAWDVVQETILAIAKQSRKNQYDPQQGSFKSWLLNLTRWRINDQFRKRNKDTAMFIASDDLEDNGATVEQIADDKTQSFEQLWENEWNQHRLKAALERVKAQVNPKQFQIFDYYVLRNWDVAKVRRQLGVSTAQIYLAKHRIKQVLEKELRYLAKQEEQNEKP